MNTVQPPTQPPPIATPSVTPTVSPPTARPSIFPFTQPVSPQAMGKSDPTIPAAREDAANQPSTPLQNLNILRDKMGKPDIGVSLTSAALSAIGMATGNSNLAAGASGFMQGFLDQREVQRDRLESRASKEREALNQVLDNIRTRITGQQFDSAESLIETNSGILGEANVNALYRDIANARSRQNEDARKGNLVEQQRQFERAEDILADMVATPGTTIQQIEEKATGLMKGLAPLQQEILRRYSGQFTSLQAQQWREEFGNLVVSGGGLAGTTQTIANLQLFGERWQDHMSRPENQKLFNIYEKALSSHMAIHAMAGEEQFTTQLQRQGSALSSLLAPGRENFVEAAKIIVGSPGGFVGDKDAYDLRVEEEADKLRDMAQTSRLREALLSWAKTNAPYMNKHDVAEAVRGLLPIFEDIYTETGAGAFEHKVKSHVVGYKRFFVEQGLLLNDKDLQELLAKIEGRVDGDFEDSKVKAAVLEGVRAAYNELIEKNAGRQKFPLNPTQDPNAPPTQDPNAPEGQGIIIQRGDGTREILKDDLPPDEGDLDYGAPAVPQSAMQDTATTKPPTTPPPSSRVQDLLNKHIPDLR